MTTPDHTRLRELLDAARREAMGVRVEPGIPIRVFIRDGVVIWSKVDDSMVDLTPENSEGMLYHVRSVFVPHGAPNPLAEREADKARIAELKAENARLRNQRSGGGSAA